MLSGGTLTGQFVQHRIRSEALDDERTVTVRLPDRYRPETEDYPVVYLKDGQNMFDRRTGFAGEEWGVDETVESLSASGALPEAILVAIDNGGARRLDEYSRVADPRHGGGAGDAYEAFIVEELLPTIERRYPIDPGRRALVGSSMGGLVCLSLGLGQPGLFAAVGALSPSVWWAEAEIADRILETPSTECPRPKIWLDMGTEEGKSDAFGQRTLADEGFGPRPTGENGVSDVRDRTREFGEALLSRGWVLDEDLRYHEPLGATHQESSWGARIGEVLTWLIAEPT